MNVAGRNIRVIRTELRLSLRSVAREAGIDSATLSRIENGTQNLTEDLAHKLGKVLYVSPGVLFADADVVEMAILNIRKAPVLTEQQLLAWEGPDNFEEAEDQSYLHTEFDSGSRYMFAIAVRDEANFPEIHFKDKLIFDAQRQPREGETIIAQAPDAGTHIGRFRLSRRRTAEEQTFDVVPYNRIGHEVTAGEQDPLKIRGVLAELRRYFPR
ncbi:MAG TPA: helix-turn-helix transcriptional regulator [Acidobacteriaceae bacterium]|nr:helix-turn-helix transcriptional regulator [Acidobacteriaceae bacterium]